MIHDARVKSFSLRNSEVISKSMKYEEDKKSKSKVENDRKVFVWNNPILGKLFWFVLLCFLARIN